MVSSSHYDILFCIAVIAAAVGYNFGAKLTKVMAAPEVISWALVLAMPFHFGFAIYYFPKTEINIISWIGFLYVAIFSQLYRDWETDRKSTRLNSSH